MNYLETKTVAGENYYHLMRLCRVVHGLPKSLYLVIDHKEVIEREWNDLRFFFEEHTCPTNFLRDVVLVIEEYSPGKFLCDPHEILEYIGWCTEKEGKEVFDLGVSYNGPIEEYPSPNDGLSCLDRTAFIKAMHERFSVVESWMEDLGVHPATAAEDHVSAFARSLALKIEAKLASMTDDEWIEKSDSTLYGPNRKLLLSGSGMDNLASLLLVAEQLDLEYQFGVKKE